MLAPQLILPIARELVVDLFAGGGGASTGLEQALGRHVDIAINHDPQAIALHAANHPQTRHFVSDVYEVDPLTVCGDQPVGLLWASPDCTYHSKARGGKPFRDRNKARRRRGLAWVVIKWARVLPADRRPRVIQLENVEEFEAWGPLGPDDMPDPARRGQTFKRWKRQLENLGYVVEHRQLRACDYGAPTIRRRLFVIARCDGEPIVWPEPTHAKASEKGRKAWRTAAECIDWSDLGKSIFERKKPLAPATMRRIAHGIKRYVIENPRPFIVPITHAGDVRAHDVHEPLRTVTAAKRGEFAIVTPHITKFRTGSVGSSIEDPLPTVTANSYVKRPGGAVPLGIVLATLIQTGYGEREGQAPRVPGLDKPLGTAVDGQKHAVVAAFLAKHYVAEPRAGRTARGADEPMQTITSRDQGALVTATLIDAAHADVSPSGVKRWGKGHRDIEQPLPTVTASGRDSALVTATLAKLRGTSNSASIDAPLHTVSAGGMHHAAVYALLLKFYGTDQDPRLEEPMHTQTTKSRFALVTVQGEQYVIADITMRMLQPQELYKAQGFPDGYQIDRDAAGAPITKEAQTRMVGNSVPPPLACALAKANYRELAVVERRAA